MFVRLAGCLLFALSFTNVFAEDFPQFRGPLGQGVIEGAEIPLDWSAETGKNIAWSVEVPGSGWSQPLVIGDRIFLTTAVASKDLSPKGFEDGVKTPQSMGMGFMTRAPKVDIDWKVLCLSAQDGSLLWEHVVESGQPQFAVHPSNTYATETPVSDGKGIYAYFGATGSVVGLSHDGDPLWQQNVGAFKTSNNFGTGSSLAIYEGQVFVQNLSQGSATITSFDCESGEQVWQQEREKNETSWSSPIVWKNDLRAELIVSGGQSLQSYEPSSGDLLWSVSKVKAATACSVCFDSQRIYFGGSDPFSTGPLIALSAGGEGDLSPDKMNTTFEHCDWLTKKAAPGMASPVSTGEFVYVSEKNILRCYAADSGERLYQVRVPDVKMVNASPLVINGQLLLLGESGNAVLVSVGKEFEVIGGGSIEDTFWSSPAVGNGSLYLRGVEKLYCIRDK